MCGRYVMDMGHGKMRDIYKSVMDMPPLLKMDVYPSNNAPILTAKTTKPILCKWGFDRYDKKGLLINARAETVAEMPTFHKDFRSHRCVVPCNGFYEWDNAKNKYCFTRADGKLLYLGGFYHEADNDSRFVVLTKNATTPVSQIHYRIPVLLAANHIDDYLNDTLFATNFVGLDSDIALNYN